LAAWVVGLSVLHGTGWSGGAVLAAFFVSSNLVSRIGPLVSYPRVDAKGDRRDGWQVFANGGAAALVALIGSASGDLRMWLVTGSLAAAAADTWATSVGAHSRVPPRLLWSGRVVAPGSSGGVTLAGSAGAALGAVLVSGVGAFVSGTALLLPAGTLIGFLGMMVDSAAGGALQGRFHCLRCNEASEWRVHRCGSETEWRAGVRWLTNDGVNFIATACAAGAAWVAWWWLD
jgi:uncharacterized protein (TIGR00297 family)